MTVADDDHHEHCNFHDRRRVVVDDPGTVTGWKGLFVNRVFTKKINELTPQESDRLLGFLYEHIDGNHDLQVRFRWEENNLVSPKLIKVFWRENLLT